MKMSFHQSVILAGLLGCCSGSRAECPARAAAQRALILPIRSAVEVKEVKGTVEYAYDGTGWRVLPAGKQLKAGATVRASRGSAAILRVDQRPTFFKISPLTFLHITSETPAEERATYVATVAQLATTAAK